MSTFVDHSVRFRDGPSFLRVLVMCFDIFCSPRPFFRHSDVQFLQLPAVPYSNQLDTTPAAIRACFWQLAPAFSCAFQENPIMVCVCHTVQDYYVGSYSAALGRVKFSLSSYQAVFERCVLPSVSLTGQ